MNSAVILRDRRGERQREIERAKSLSPIRPHVDYIQGVTTKEEFVIHEK